MRITDIFLAIPYIVLAVAIAIDASGAARTRSSSCSASPAGWRSAASCGRASSSLKQLEYVEAATALGLLAGTRIMFRHILPNALQPIIVYGTIAVGGVILAEAALSFLGVGPADPTPAWGLMVAEGKGALAVRPAPAVLPGHGHLPHRPRLRVRR